MSIDKTRVIGMSLDKIFGIMKQCMRKPEGKIRCQVLKNNIFRSAYAERSEVHKHVTQSSLADVTLTSSKCTYFKTKLLKLWNPEARDFEGYHVVNFVHPTVAPSEGNTMIFFGDVLMQLNGHDVSHVEPGEIQRLYDGKPSISVVFHETSVLRRKDLHEAGIDPENDVADTELERMALGAANS